MAGNTYTTPLGIKEVSVRDSFFSRLMDIAKDKMIPYQWLALNDAAEGATKSYCLRNFRSAAGLINAEHGGFVFQDSDLAKWIEAAANMLNWNRDPETEAHIDEVVELVEKAQLPDGYVNTYYVLTGIDKRWTNVRDNHELYCAGHMLEAAVSYFEATGKRRLLDVMIRFVDHIYSRFGREEGKLHGYPGHEELELALMRLYDITGDEKHLELAKYFIDERGKQPSFFDLEAEKDNRRRAWERSVYENNSYYQADVPVREQKTARGHSVRACYLYSGMADVARATNDDSLKQACAALWKNITRRQMYITGAIGQSAFGEAFTFDYDLPNDLVYGETCASIALMFFASRMLRLEAKGEYADIMDKLIYNGTISGMSLSGDRFFYVNPLESIPERSARNQQFAHVKSERQKWFGCACCPPNLARLISSLPSYAFHKKGNTLYCAMYTSCDVKTELDGGTAAVSMETDYPWNGRIKLKLENVFDGLEIALRLPAWAKTYELSLNGKYVITRMDEGFIYIKESFKPDDEIVLDLDMPVTVMRAHPRAQADAGKIAIQRGPIVYCLEETDNGRCLHNVSVSADASFTVINEPDLLGGVNVIECEAERELVTGWDDYELYAGDRKNAVEKFTARFVPYYAWNNRGIGEMRVWVRELR